MATVTSWDFKKNHVDETAVKDNMRNFLSAESVIICRVPEVSGGPEFNVAEWIPVGFIESASVQQRRQINELFEIGSKLQYQIPGRNIIRVNLNRLLLDGPSLLRVISPEAGVIAPGAAGETDSPGESDGFYVNLASSFFDNNVNLGIVMRDKENENYAAMMLKGCNVESHQFGISSQQTVLVESASLACREVIPLEYKAVRKEK